MDFPVRRQLEAVDCGPTCIQMIAAYYKKDIPISIIKEYCNVTRLGISLKDVIDGCKSLGLKAVSAHVNIDNIKKMPLPAILYWRQEHYVVLYDIKKKKQGYIYYLVDPSFGKVKVSESDFLKDWTVDNRNGIAVMAAPTDDFLDSDANSQSVKKDIRKIFKPFHHLKKYKKNLVYALLLSSITFVCAWLIPFILQKIIDIGIENKDMHFIFLLLLGQLALFIGNLISSSVSNIILFKTGLNIGIEIATTYIKKLVRLPIRFFDSKLGTDLLQRLNDESKIRDFLTYTVNTIVLMSLNLLVYSCVLLYYNVYIFLIFLIFSVLSGILAKLVLKSRKHINYSMFTNYSIKKNVEYELVSGMIEIKTNTAHDLYLSKWEDSQVEINRLSIKYLFLSYYLDNGTVFLNVLRDIIITGLCAYMVITGQLTLGIMMTITYILGQLSGTMNQVTNFAKNFQDSKLAYDRIEEIQKQPDENDDRNINIHPSVKLKNGFSLRNISFKYEGTFNPYVLKNITLDIPVGKVTAIVGASGSGKTTLLKLLLAFYYPQEGDIYLDNLKMSEINTDDWHRRCGVVMQDGYIFSGTIAHNIALSEKQPDKKRLSEAARVACISDFIERLPMKYDTKIGKSGIDLSGGEKQRILIARAVYKNPEFIFFDEATSSLDANNEKAIMKNLKEFYKGKTVVIVAHRLSTVKDADNIIVLDRGNMVEDGNHVMLTRMQGIYYNLVKNQLELGN